jgi:hypothetical protein
MERKGALIEGKLIKLEGTAISACLNSYIKKYTIQCLIRGIITCTLLHL